MTKDNLSVASPAYSGAALEWLNALPQTPWRADLVGLDHDFAIRCIHELVENKTFELNVAAHYPSDEAFNHFYFEARNREKVFGTKNLGVGYPMALARLGGHEITAPLFVWQIHLEPHAQQSDQWVAQRNEAHRVIPNYPLFHLVDALYGTDCSLRARELTEGRQLNPRSLADFCEYLRSKLSLSEDGLPLSVQPSPRPAEALDAIQEGHLCWSAVVGLFPSLPRTTVTEPPSVAPDLPADQQWQHAFTLLPLDPSQRATLQAIQRNALTVVEGASGTGKTYLISAVLINALANGKKCLVVSKSINALRRAQKFLLDKGIGDTSFIVRDLASDQMMLSDMLRMTADNKNRPAYDEEAFRALFNRVQREQRKLDDAWEELHAPVFGDKNFTETTGLFLRANRIEGKELLLNQLNPSDFVFNKEEYDQIIASIYTSEPLFRRFPTLQHPLARLSYSVFLENNAAAGLEVTHNRVKLLLDKSTGLYHRYLGKINDYSEALLDHYESYYNELSNLIKRIRDGLEDGTNRFGADFEKPISTAEKLYGVFSDRYKEIVASKEKIGAIFDDLRKAHGLRKYFEFDFPAYFDLKNIKKVSELTRDFESAMRLWRRRIPAVVREDLRRLNAKSIHPALDYREQIKDLEYSLDLFVEEFNATGLYEAPIKHEMLTIPKRQEFLEDVIGRLEETQFYLRDFEDFYIWQKHWLSLPPAAQKVVRALCKVKPNNWQAAFESWYLHHLLQNEFNPNLQWDEDMLQAHSDSTRELRNLLPIHIGAYWAARKEKALRALRRENALSFKTWFGKNNRTLSAAQKAEELFKKHILPLTETLPVLLVTPEVALDVVQNSNMTFDLVLVDEGHNIPKQECYHLFELAKSLAIFGDSKQDMTPSAEDDILEFCKGIGAKTLQLEYQHQDCPEAWIHFNRIAFGTPFKRMPYHRDAQAATTVINVEGRYDETRQVNEAEARQVIDWLNLIEPTPAKTYPVVGIACSTIQQRDLIAAQLLKIRQRKAPGHEKIQQLHLSGMGVYQFAEMQGQHVDVLLVSLTHGTTDSHGTLTQHLHFWNSQLGFNQLHVLLTRATQKVYIAHSIPPGLHQVLAADKRHLGTCVLSHLVTYADAVQNGDAFSAEEQLTNLRTLLQVHDQAYPFTLFMEEVEIALRPYFDALQMRRNALAAGMHVPLYLGSNESTAHGNVVLFDGVLSHTAQPSYEWEEKVRIYFHKQGIGVAPAYAAHWWRSPRQEARKLAGRLLR